MNVIDLATKTIQLAIQTAVAGVKTIVDGIKTTTDATKTKVDSIDTRTNAIETTVNTVNTNVETILNERVVKSVQRGTLTMPASASAPINVSVSSVSLSKSFLQFSIRTSSTNYVPVSGKIVLPTQLRFERIAFAQEVIVEWQLIEYY